MAGCARDALQAAEPLAGLARAHKERDACHRVDPAQNPALGVWRLASGVWRLASGVWRLASGVWRLPGLWRSG